MKRLVLFAVIALSLSACSPADVPSLADLKKDVYQTEISTQKVNEAILNQPWVNNIKGNIATYVGRGLSLSIDMYVDTPEIGRLRFVTHTPQTPIYCVFPMQFHLNEDKTQWVVSTIKSVAESTPKEDLTTCLDKHLTKIDAHVALARAEHGEKIERMKEWKKVD